MSTLLAAAVPDQEARARAAKPARVALLGTGNVGSAVSARLASWSGTPLAGRISLVHVANSRHAISNRFGVPDRSDALLLASGPRGSSLESVAPALG